MIIATDGIWQYMSNQNVAAIAQAHYEQGAAEAAANAIVRRAAQLWRDVSLHPPNLSLERGLSRRHYMRRHLPRSQADRAKPVPQRAARGAEGARREEGGNLTLEQSRVGGQPPEGLLGPKEVSA